MERYRNFVRLEQMKECIRSGRQTDALEIAETLDFKKIRNNSDINLMADLYLENGMYEKAYEALREIHSRKPGRTVLMQLINLTLTLKNTKAAERFYEEFHKLAPNDYYNHIYRYNIDKLEKKGLDVLIEDLETLKKAEYIDVWAYELAKMYHKSGQGAKCAKECKDIETWFGDGEYVDRARALRKYYRGELNLDEEEAAVKDEEKDASEAETVTEQETVPVQEPVSEQETVSEPETLTEQGSEPVQETASGQQAEEASKDIRKPEDKRIAIEADDKPAHSVSDISAQVMEMSIADILADNKISHGTSKAKQRLNEELLRTGVDRSTGTKDEVSGQDTAPSVEASEAENEAVEEAAQAYETDEGEIEAAAGATGADEAEAGDEAGEITEEAGADDAEDSVQDAGAGADTTLNAEDVSVEVTAKAAGAAGESKQDAGIAAAGDTAKNAGVVDVTESKQNAESEENEITSELSSSSRPEDASLSAEEPVISDTDAASSTDETKTGEEASGTGAADDIDAEDSEGADDFAEEIRDFDEAIAVETVDYKLMDGLPEGDEAVINGMIEQGMTDLAMEVNAELAREHADEERWRKTRQEYKEKKNRPEAREEKKQEKKSIEVAQYEPERRQVDKNSLLGQFLNKRGEQLENYFGFLASHPTVGTQLVKNLEILLNPQIKNICLVVTGVDEKELDIVIKGTAKAMYNSGYLEHKQIFNSKAEKLDGADLENKVDKLIGSCFVIRQAGDMHSDAAAKLLAVNNRLLGHTVVVLADEKSRMNGLFRDHRELTSMFPQRIHIPDVEEKDVVDFMQYMIHAEGYMIEKGAVAEIERIARGLHSRDNAISKAEKLVTAACDKVETRNAKTFMKREDSAGSFMSSNVIMKSDLEAAARELDL